MPGTIGRSGKRPSLLPHRVIDVQLPIILLDEVDARLFDPRTGKLRYGARNALVARLLSEWVQVTPVHPRVLELLEANKPTLDDLISTEGSI